MALPGFVTRAIEKELEYQDDKYGADKQQSFPGYLLLMRKELEEAEQGWIKGPWNGRNSALGELVQVVALGIRALTQYGVDGCPAATNDSYNSSNDFKSANDEFVRTTTFYDSMNTQNLNPNDSFLQFSAIKP